MHSLVQPNAWVALKLPSNSLRVLQVVPNTTISLGKYGSFPSNLIINRPFHLTYEVQDRLESDSFTRLRIVPASELYSDTLAESDAAAGAPEIEAPENEDEDGQNALPTGVEYALVDPDSGAVVAKTDRAELDPIARQTLTMEEIEALKKDGTDAGKDLIAKLMLSHTAIERKTEYSLAKYKLLKTKKYIRRFTVLPMDVPLLDHWLVEEKDASRVLDMRDEMMGLLGCWGNVHSVGPSQEDIDQEIDEEGKLISGNETEPTTGRWLVVDDTGGLLVAGLAERMGILYPDEANTSQEKEPAPQSVRSQKKGAKSQPAAAASAAQTTTESSEKMDEDKPEKNKEAPQQQEGNEEQKLPLTIRKRPNNDLRLPYANTNTITLIHHNSQPNAAFLRYFDFDVINPTPSHPLSSHLLTLSWLQLLSPELDSTYSQIPPAASPEEIRTWKANRRGQYHRKRRRWARSRYIVDSTRRPGNFSGLVVASTMDPISILRHTVPLLAGGAPVAVYSQTVEPLTQLMDAYSVARRAAWSANPPTATTTTTITTEDGGEVEEVVEDENWAGSEEFPLNPSLLLGATLQTSRARKWQVLPGRTHPLMTGKGGPEGYVFTAFKVKPAGGRVEARGKARSRKRKVAPTTTTTAAGSEEQQGEKAKKQ